MCSNFVVCASTATTHLKPPNIGDYTKLKFGGMPKKFPCTGPKLDFSIQYGVLTGDQIEMGT
jgi:hypothetical protein